MNNKNGKRYFYTIFVLNVIAEIGERIFPIFYLDARNYIPQTTISIIALFFIFYGIDKGYNWLKYILITLLFFGFIVSIYRSFEIYSTKMVFYDSNELTSNSILSNIISCILLTTGLIRLSSAIIFLFSKNMKSFLSIKRNTALILSRKERLANSIYDIGVAIAVIGASHGLLVGLMNTILNPSLIIGFLIYLPIKIPLYAVPGFIIMYLGLLLKRNVSTKGTT